MSGRAEEYKSAEELRREIADLKIQLAFQEKFEEEVEEILAECENPDPKLMKVLCEEEKGLLEEISHQHNKSLHDVKWGLRVTVRRVAAMVIIGMLISVSSAMATIHMVRTGVFALDIVGDSRRISVRMVQGHEADIPDGWKGEYYPTFIPKEYEFSSCFGGCDATYLDANGNWMSYSENEYGERKSIDTEDAKISSIQINGMDAIVIEKEGVSTVVWSIDNRYFVVGIIGKKETAIQIAASVIMIK